MIISIIGLFLVVVGWVVTSLQNNATHRKQHLFAHHSSLQNLAKEDVCQFLSDCNNMQRLLLINKVEMQKKTFELFCPRFYIRCLKLFRFRNKQDNTTREKFDDLINFVDEEGQKLSDTADSIEKEKFLVGFNSNILEILRCLQDT